MLMAGNEVQNCRPETWDITQRGTAEVISLDHKAEGPRLKRLREPKEAHRLNLHMANKYLL